MGTDEKIEELKINGIKVDSYWTYKVVKDGNNLIFSFDTRPFVRKIRHHTSGDYYPYADINITSGDNLVVGPNQWLHGLVDGQWSHLTDADNR